MNKPTPNYANPQLPAMVEEAFQLQRLLFNRAVEISSATGLKVGEILERIAHMCDCHEPSLEAFMAFDEHRPPSGTLRPQPKSLHSIVLTLQYCLETFEQNCQCGRCDPCSRGRNEIKQAIQMLEFLPDVRQNSGWALLRFFVEGQGVRAEFADLSALAGFVRKLLPLEMAEALRADPSMEELECVVSSNAWWLIDYGEGFSQHGPG